MRVAPELRLEFCKNTMSTPMQLNKSFHHHVNDWLVRTKKIAKDWSNGF
jgi:hypothetical protein